MNKSLVVVVGILAMAAVAICIMWPCYNRYYILVGPKGMAYEIDRKTGKTWVLIGPRKIEHQERRSRETAPPKDP